MKKTQIALNDSLNDLDDSPFISCTKRRPTTRLCSPKNKRTKKEHNDKLSKTSSNTSGEPASQKPLVTPYNREKNKKPYSSETSTSNPSGSEDTFNLSQPFNSLMPFEPSKNVNALDEIHTPFDGKGSSNELKLTCPFCSKQFENGSAHISHAKQCAKKKNISTAQLIEKFHRNVQPHGAISSGNAPVKKPTLEKFGFTSAVPPGPKRGKITKSKFPVLRTRTTADRINLLTEKAAIVLLDENKTSLNTEPDLFASEIASKPLKVSGFWEMSVNEQEACWYSDHLKNFISPMVTKRPAQAICEKTEESQEFLESFAQPLFKSESSLNKLLDDWEAPASTLVEDWSRMVNNSELSDISLLTLDGVINVHSLVLRVRCPAFFASNYEDICSKVKSSHLIIFLKHVYSGKLTKIFPDDLKPLLLISKSFSYFPLLQIVSTLSELYANKKKTEDDCLDDKLNNDLQRSGKNIFNDNKDLTQLELGSAGGFLHISPEEADTEPVFPNSQVPYFKSDSSDDSLIMPDLYKRDDKIESNSDDSESLPSLPRSSKMSPVSDRIPKIVINPLCKVFDKSSSMDDTMRKQLVNIGDHISSGLFNLSPKKSSPVLLKKGTKEQLNEGANEVNVDGDLADTVAAGPLTTFKSILSGSHSLVQDDDDVTEIPSSVSPFGNKELSDLFENEPIRPNSHNELADTVPNTVDLTLDSPGSIEEENLRNNQIGETETDALERTKINNYVDHQSIINQSIVEDIEKTELEESQSERVKLMNMSRNADEIEKDLFEDDDDCAVVTREPKPPVEVIDVLSDSDAGEDTQLVAKVEQETVCPIPYFSPHGCDDYLDYFAPENVTLDGPESQSLFSGLVSPRTPRKVVGSATTPLKMTTSRQHRKSHCSPTTPKQITPSSSTPIKETPACVVTPPQDSPPFVLSEVFQTRTSSVQRRRSSAAQRVGKKIVRRSLKSLNDRSRNQPKDPSLLSTSIKAGFEDSWNELQNLNEPQPSNVLPPTNQVSKTPVLRKEDYVEITPCVTPSLNYSDKVTPRPHYSAMKSASLKRNLQRYGLKKSLGKTKAKKILSHIYDELHPIINTETGKFVQILNENETSKKTKKAASQANKKTKQANDKTSQKVGCSASQSTSRGAKTPEKLTSSKIASSPSNSSVDLKSSFISNISDDGNMEFSALDDEILTQAPQTSMTVMEAVKRYIKEDSSMRLSVLTYQPIWVEELRRSIQTAYAAKFKLTDIIDSLDKLCITFRSESQLNANLKRNERKKQRRSPKKKTGSSPKKKDAAKKTSGEKTN